jgi:hypothetical protein
MTHTIVSGGFPKTGIQIESYQGQRARDYLAESARSEVAFQDERKGQPNN